MKILFIINAINQWERVGILTLSAVLKRSGHEVGLFNIRGKRIGRVLEELRRSEPDVLAYSAMTNEADKLLRVNQLIRSDIAAEIKSVFGGPHATFFPQIIRENGVDAVCRGEGEGSFRWASSMLWSILSV